MKKIITYSLISFILFSCKEKKEVLIVDVENVIKKEEIVETIINKSLQNVIDDYIEIYTLSKEGSLPTKQSYYLGFLRLEKDTLLAFGRQPFLFDLFPDFVFNYKPPKAIIKSKGMFYYKKNIPIIIFDENSLLGINFYDINKLKNQPLDEYKIKEEFDTLIPPIWKFKIKDNQLIFLERVLPQKPHIPKDP